MVRISIGEPTRKGPEWSTAREWRAMHDPSAVILAGGAGRRIGGRKAFVELGGRP
jgi:hypothetical protein